MSGYALTPLAKADVFAIWSYIADDNEDAVLDAGPLSQLHHRLPARDSTASGCRCSAREKKCAAHPEAAPMKNAAHDTAFFG